MTVSHAQETEKPSGKPWRQSAARDLVSAYVKTHPNATVREITTACGLRSTGHVHQLLKQIRADLCVCPTCGGKGSIRRPQEHDGRSKQGAKSGR